MLQIGITQGHPDGTLTITINGRPSNGNCRADKAEDVHWNVESDSDVKSIDNIIMKTHPPSTDIFSNDPPEGQGNPPYKHWKGKVNNNAIDYSKYRYSISWTAEDGSARVYDPIISIRPSGFDLIMWLGAFFSGLFVISLLFSRKKKRSK